MIDINSILDSLEQKSWLDWGVILQAWKGLPCTDLKLSTDFISDYAIAQIEKQEDDVTPVLTELSYAKLLERGRITFLLEEICAEENIQETISLKKLRIATLEKIIDQTFDNCIFVLTELNNFWRSWGNPSDQPCIIEGFETSTNPHEYYSEANFKKLLDAHKIWLEKEKSDIADSQYL